MNNRSGSMVIRKAQSGDEQAIFELARERSFAGSPGHYDGKDGFIVFPKSTEKFLKRINLCLYFFVAENKGKIVGYILLNSLNEIKRLNEDLPYMDELKKFSKGRKIIYLDQLVVAKEESGKGIGQALLDYAKKN